MIDSDFDRLSIHNWPLNFFYHFNRYIGKRSMEVYYAEKFRPDNENPGSSVNNLVSLFDDCFSCCRDITD